MKKLLETDKQKEYAWAEYLRHRQVDRIIEEEKKEKKKKRRGTYSLL